MFESLFDIILTDVYFIFVLVLKLAEKWYILILDPNLIYSFMPNYRRGAQIANLGKKLLTFI